MFLENSINYLFYEEEIIVDKKQEYSLTKFDLEVWGISDYARDSMFLIEGSEKSLLVDTGMGTGNLKGFIQNITDKPIEVVITHAHWDHIGQVDQFERVYMSEKEREIISLFEMDIDLSNFSDIKDGDIIDLGDRQLEVIEVPGHTPGSIVLLDAANKLLFSSDAIGTGHLWMHIPGTLTLEEYSKSLKKLAERKDDFEKIFTGHLLEVGNEPLDLEYFNNIIFLVEQVLAGEIKGEEYNNGPFPGLFVEKGRALLVYDPEKTR